LFCYTGRNLSTTGCSYGVAIGGSGKNLECSAALGADIVKPLGSMLPMLMMGMGGGAAPSMPNANE